MKKFKDNFVASLFVTVLVAEMLISTGCGMFGRKPASKTEIELGGGTGCLNTLSAQVNSFTAGTLADEELNSSVDCIVSAYDQFITTSRGSDDTGYTTADMTEFSNIFLFTNTQIRPQFMEAAFDLKTSILGGSREVLARDQLDVLIELLKSLKPDLLNLLQQFRTLRGEGTLNQILGTHTAVTGFFTKVIDGIPFTKQQEFSAASAMKLSEEIQKSFDFSIDSNSITVAYAGLALITNGQSDSIRSENWPRVANAAINGLSLMNSYKKLSAASNDKASGVTASRAMLAYYPLLETLGNQILAWNNGKIEIDRLKWMTEQIPANWLKKGLGDLGDPVALNLTYEPLLRKLLKTRHIENGKATALDTLTLTTVFDLLRRLTLSQFHLDIIFEQAGALQNGLNRQDFIQKALVYQLNLSAEDQVEVQRMISVATLAPALFQQGAGEMSFMGLTRQSLTNLSIFQAMDLASETLLKVYGNGGASPMATPMTTPMASPDGLKQLLQDFEPILLASKLLDKTIYNYANIHNKNFGQANIYTTVSNGDEYLDRNEVAHYLSAVVSISNLSSRVRKTMTAKCGMGTQHRDPLDWEWMNETCFRDKFFKESSLFDNFPNLQNQFQDPSLRAPLELIARRVQFQEGDPIGSNDIAGYTGFFHFLELMMMKFDVGSSEGVLTKDELLGRTYNDFRGLLKKTATTMIGSSGGIAGWLVPQLLENESFIKALFTWIVKEQKIPSSVGNFADLAAWWAIGPSNWNVSADRTQMIRVMALF